MGNTAKTPASILALCLVGALTLAGCSRASDTTEADISDDTFSDSRRVSDEFPVTIPTKFGDVTIEEQPQRVVTLGWGDTDTALALGVQPVGNMDWLSLGGNGVGSWAQDQYTQTPEVLDREDMDYEKIAALEPDVIINVKTSGDEDQYDKLSSIAPTVGIPEGGEGSRTPMNQQVEMIAAALGKQDKGADLIDQVESRYRELREKYPQWKGKTLSSLYHSEANWSVYLPGDARADVPAALGFELDPRVAEIAEDVERFTVDISTEQLDRADSDVVIGIPVGEDKSSLESDNAWKNLTAVREGRAFALDEEQTDAFSMGSVSSILYALDELEPLLAEATSPAN
ncbi:hypothetical protein BJF89_17160 [Corynebacterium sp. CNJ-954]|uniref:iron-siderophore ABC transporter substrate-binding protein n=1 Tax=Corynebacterium sp. CNJ-954 TaxID=1904962 RepID=UPI0009638A7F|nr:iron-siderophore ABC transporter substrate-binding protein [Corynebacterium sp. CNJ-954]OLT54196.1 hypothetical protein BJF89_17160 [Corynebacterium sp. CNJ-954]